MCVLRTVACLAVESAPPLSCLYPRDPFTGLAILLVAAIPRQAEGGVGVEVRLFLRDDKEGLVIPGRKAKAIMMTINVGTHIP
jgi:hypothetical protein